MADQSARTREVARGYFDAWTSKRTADVSAALAPEFEFSAGGFTVSGRDAFLANPSFPSGAVVKMVAEAYEGPTAIQIYDATNGEASVRIAEHLTVRDGAVVSSSIVTDNAAFSSFMQAG
jgi:hypothetical protein